MSSAYVEPMHFVTLLVGNAMIAFPRLIQGRSNWDEVGPSVVDTWSQGHALTLLVNSGNMRVCRDTYDPKRSNQKREAVSTGDCIGAQPVNLINRPHRRIAAVMKYAIHLAINMIGAIRLWLWIGRYSGLMSASIIEAYGWSHHYEITIHFGLFFSVKPRARRFSAQSRSSFDQTLAVQRYWGWHTSRHWSISRVRSLTLPKQICCFSALVLYLARSHWCRFHNV